MPDNDERPSGGMRPTAVVDAVVERMEASERKTPHSRIIEDVLAFAGIFQALFYGVLEALRSAGFKLGDCPTEHSFPWVTLSILACCVAPKTLGRATAGKVWSGLSNILPGGGKNA